ncbi:DUF4158 domain-containing protein [Micromonospora sp. KC213]|uniref:DUF4158 domain-containing protein n=1 Tax=Micromonospora sp. KC213 TaxID=2530378 RepID=UPI00104CFEC4|nr:DUF4158 domain-containing protein [Micromonospora sp. KC213]TDC43019.1 DUF4158 domain-containing protein [Micromonospora sp. KC213]
MGFALLLKFYTRAGRFPRGRGELPDEAVEFVARQVGVDPNELGLYAWAGRTIEYHRAQIRGHLGFRECSVADADKLTGWLAASVCEAERRLELVRDELLVRCRAERIEPPAAGRIDRIVRSALHQAEQALTGGRVDMLDGGVPLGRDRCYLVMQLRDLLGQVGAPGPRPAGPGAPRRRAAGVRRRRRGRSPARPGVASSWPHTSPRWGLDGGSPRVRGLTALGLLGLRGARVLGGSQGVAPFAFNWSSSCGGEAVHCGRRPARILTGQQREFRAPASLRYKDGAFSPREEGNEGHSHHRFPTARRTDGACRRGHGGHARGDRPRGPRPRRGHLQRQQLRRPPGHQPH